MPPGGPLPNLPPDFDVFYLDSSDIAGVFFYNEVSYAGDPVQLDADSINSDLEMVSGGVYYPTTDSRVYFSVLVPATFTFETTVTFTHLPPNFGSILTDHIFLGIFDPTGTSAGMFFSKIGMAYSGSVHHDSSGQMVLDSTVQPLPNSQTLIQEGVQYTLRIASDYVTGTTYIYFTETDLVPSIGQQLRYVLPAFYSADMVQAPSREVLLSVSGTLARPSDVTFSELALGSGLLIPNIPPRADAGSDQAARTCSIIQLDGSRSVDPQGGPLTYLWQLVSAPLGSQFIFDGDDGFTIPLLVPTGFTDHLYSTSLGVLDGQDAIVAGDVLVVGGIVYTIQSVGSDVTGFYVRVEGYDLPDSLAANTPFKMLRQRGISGRTLMKPTFLPDVPGLYKFNLIVNNGALSSEPAEVIVNITASSLPRGIVPDLKFMWDYLSDFWHLVEDRERIEVFWSALAQVVSSELLTLWQIDYAKSLRDIQRTFQRRWLHYDLLLKEQPQLIELSTVRAVFGGVQSTNIPTAGTTGISGNHLDLFLVTQPQPVVIYFSGADPQTAQQIVDRINSFMHAIDPLVVARVVPRRDGTAQAVRIDAPYAFSVAGTSTVTLFAGQSNGLATGSMGTVVGPRGYRVEKSLANLPIQEGDYLSVGPDTFRIARVIDDPNDPFFYQRLNLLEDVPASTGMSWLISGQTTSTSLDFYAGLVTAGDVVTLDVLDIAAGQISTVVVPATGASSETPGTLGIDATMVGRYLLDPTRFGVFFVSVTRRQYTPVDPLVKDVPYLQQIIKNTDDTQILRRNLDFFIDSFRGNSCLRFAVNNNIALDIWEGQVPPPRLWAETTYLDNRPTIEANFGLPAEFTLDDLSTLPENVDYLSAVRGLWYAYFNGPTVFNIKAGVQILLGLPYAEETGTIEEIRDDFSTTNGRILVRDLVNTEIVRSYTFPHSLLVETNPATGKPYVVGDKVVQFSPLVKGVEVLDYVNSSKWFGGYVGQGAFFEVEKFFKFLIRVDSKAFNLNALLFVKSFVLRIKPTYTFPLFVVLANVPSTEVLVDDAVAISGYLNLHEGPCYHGPAWNIAGMWDQPRASGGGQWSKYDYDGITPPIYPYPTAPVPWGFDHELICPEYFVLGSLRMVWPGGVPAFDLGIFSWDLPLTTTLFATFGAGFITDLHSTPSYSIGVTPALATGTINYVYFEIDGQDGGGNPFTLEVWANGVLAGSVTFNKGYTGRDYQAAPLSIAVTLGDSLEVRFKSSTARAEGDWRGVIVCLVAGTTWAYDTTFPAGTYYRYRGM